MTRTNPTLGRALFPTRGIALLLAVGFIDLVATAVLHSQGLIVELNPVMRPLIEKGEWLFVAVKSLTLLVGWLAMVSYSRVNLDFVRRASILGACAYVSLWTAWFLVGKP